MFKLEAPVLVGHGLLQLRYSVEIVQQHRTYDWTIGLIGQSGVPKWPAFRHGDIVLDQSVACEYLAAERLCVLLPILF